MARRSSSSRFPPNWRAAIRSCWPTTSGSRAFASSWSSRTISTRTAIWCSRSSRKPHGAICFAGRRSEAAELRRAEVIDLGGVGRDYLVDAMAGALSIPIVTDPHPMVRARGVRRGETHRLCDRPSALVRLLDELVDLGVEQILIVSARPNRRGLTRSRPPRLDGRAPSRRIPPVVGSGGRPRCDTMVAGAPRVFTIRPSHNPIGPFDFGGGYDDRSDRRQPLDELMSRGYEDAYHQFIEPVVGASGERVGLGS